MRGGFYCSCQATFACETKSQPEFNIKEHWLQQMFKTCLRSCRQQSQRAHHDWKRWRQEVASSFEWHLNIQKKNKNWFKKAAIISTAPPHMVTREDAAGNGQCTYSQSVASNCHLRDTPQSPQSPFVRCARAALAVASKTTPGKPQHPWA